MKFTDILKTAANVGSGIFLGAPIFADKPKLQDLPAMIPNNTSTKIAAAIAIVEQLTTTIPKFAGLTKEEKLAMGAAIAKDSVLASSVLVGAKVADQTRFDLGVTQMVEAWNNILKSVEKA